MANTAETTTRAQKVRLSTSLLASSVVGRLPQAMSSLALIRLVLATGGTYQLAGAATASFALSSTLVSPLLSRSIDRTGRPRPALLISAVVAALAFAGAALLVRTAPWAVLLFVIVAGAATPPLEPALRRLWPVLMRPGRELARAFSADAAAQELIFILGPLATVAVLPILGPGGTVIAMGAIGLIGTGLFCLHKMLRPAPPETAMPHPGRSALRIPAIRMLVLGQFAAGIPVGALVITASAHAEAVGAPALSGWGLALNAAGAMVGALYVARRPPRRAAESNIRWLLLALSVLYVPTAFVHTPALYWLPATFVSGLCLSPLLTQVFTATEHVTPRAQLTEANAWVVSGLSVGIAASTFGAGVILSHFPHHGAATAAIAASVLGVAGASLVSPRVLIQDSIRAAHEHEPSVHPSVDAGLAALTDHGRRP